MLEVFTFKLLLPLEIEFITLKRSKHDDLYLALCHVNIFRSNKIG